MKECGAADLSSDQTCFSAAHEVCCSCTSQTKSPFTFDTCHLSSAPSISLGFHCGKPVLGQNALWQVDELSGRDGSALSAPAGSAAPSRSWSSGCFTNCHFYGRWVPEVSIFRRPSCNCLLSEQELVPEILLEQETNKSQKMKAITRSRIYNVWQEVEHWFDWLNCTQTSKHL